MGAIKQKHIETIDDMNKEPLYKCAMCKGTDEDCDFRMSSECFEEVGEVYCVSCYEGWLERDPKDDECGHDKWLADNGY